MDASPKNAEHAERSERSEHSALRTVALDDKYQLASGRVYLNGTQALVRLPMLQRARDERAGLNTAGFVSGYRGSPLGNVDHEFWRAKKFLEPLHIHFQAGLNEDLAATAVWGTQQVTLDRNATYDGVFAMWYGKGPGVDRSGDVFRTPTLRAARDTAACWRLPATTTRPSPRRCRTRPSTSSRR
jgi:hypothetical protein